jgi:hypothetical protein
MPGLFSAPAVTNGMDPLHPMISLLHSDSANRYFVVVMSPRLISAAAPSRPVRPLVQTPGVPDPAGHGSTAPSRPRQGNSRYGNVPPPDLAPAEHRNSAPATQQKQPADHGNRSGLLLRQGEHGIT